MKKITLEHFCDLLEIMEITTSIDSGFAITHCGHISGTPIVITSAYRGNGECVVIE